LDATIPDDIFIEATETLTAQRKLRADGRRLETLCDGLGNIISGNSASPASTIDASKSSIITLMVTLSLMLQR